MSIGRHFRAVYERLQEIERRQAAGAMRGKVTDVDQEKQLVRIALGKDDDGNDVKSPWMPVQQAAGGLKVRSLPTVGQVMTSRGESGDLEQGVLDPYNWTENNPAPTQQEGDHVVTYGAITIRALNDVLTLSVGGTSIIISDGQIRLVSDHVVAESETLKHNDRNVGGDHVHKDVVTGNDESGPPKD